MAERPCELGDFKKARVNGGTNNHSLKGFSQVSPLLNTDVDGDAINIAADHHMFMTLTGELS